MPDRILTISQWQAAERECWEEGRDYVPIAFKAGLLIH